MAREHVQYLTARWVDPQWRQLSVDAQWLVGALAGQRLTSVAGITPLLPRRWRRLAVDLSQDRVDVALGELVGTQWIVVDHDEDLVWLRTYMADHGVFAQPNALRAALADVRACESALIREAVADLLALVPQDSAGLVIGGPRRPSRATIPPAVRRAVYERDDWTCQDCGRRIDPSSHDQLTGAAAPYDASGWLELDHIDPWSRGGEDTVENLRALCTPCNQARGARLLVDPRGGQ